MEDFRMMANSRMYLPRSLRKITVSYVPILTPRIQSILLSEIASLESEVTAIN